MGIKSRQTLSNWKQKDIEFAKNVKAAKDKVGLKLRAKAYNMAIAGSVPMLIFLLKTMCGLRENEQSITSIQPIKVLEINESSNVSGETGNTDASSQI